MIYIFEDKKKRLSGVTSLFISFKYDARIIEVLKTCEVYSFDKDSLLWELPLTSLSKLLDSLVFIDDVTLTVLDSKEEIKEEREPELDYKVKPFKYQLEDIKYGLNHDKFYLLLDPGLGKTLISTYIAEELHHKEHVEHCLVICGIASLRDNWKKEISKTSTLDCMIVGERFNSRNRRVWMSIPERVEQLMKPIKEFFIIINVESLVDERIVNALIKGPNKIDIIIADELHKMSGTKAKRSNNMLNLTAKHMIGMTGTLIVNNPVNCYNSLVWLGFEPKRSLTKFKQMYCVYSDFTRGRIVGYKNLDILQDEISSHGIRRVKSETLELPELTTINEYLTMNDAQSKFYYDIADSVKRNSNTKQLAIKSCDKIELDTTNLLSIITRLRQATTSPSYLTSQNICSVKIDRTETLVEEIIHSNEKVVIFSSFKEPLNILKERLKEYNPLLLTGDISDEEFSSNIDKFQEDDKYKVILGTFSKAGTGITLTKASYMIMLDEPWTYSLYCQARDRIYRIGSKKSITVYNLICENTIDSKIAEIIDRKKALSNYLIDDVNDQETLSILQNFVFDI